MDIFKAVGKVHEVTNYKSADQLVVEYRNAGLMGSETVKMIKNGVRDCKVCQMFGKSMVKAKDSITKGRII